MPNVLQDEVRYAINKMKQDRAPGIAGITTKLLQGGEKAVFKAMHILVTKINKRKTY